MQEIKDKIIGLVEERFGEVTAASARDGAEIFAAHGRGWASGALDSLDRMEFIMAVEDAFRIEIPDVLVPDIKTVDEVVELVVVRTSGPANGAH